MTQYETCRHVKEDGSYCGSPALRDQKYCYYHLLQRERRLRRARALRDNLPYRLDIPELDSLYAIRRAVSETAQALASGQLDPRVAGKLLYSIQLATTANRRIEQREAAQAESSAPADNPADSASRVHELPGFEQQLGLPPGADLDAETAVTLQQADEQAERRQADAMPPPPPGLRVSSIAYRVYREEAYQTLQLQVNRLRHELRDYTEMKRQQSLKEIEQFKKEAASVPFPPDAFARGA